MTMRCRCGIALAVVFALYPSVAAAQAGVLDPTFSEGGKALIPFDPNGIASLSMADAAVQSDGRIVVAGTVVENGLDCDPAVARLNSDGSVDGEFGVGGEVVVPFNLGGYNIDTANAVALQPDGKIVVAGAAQLGTDDRDFAVARLNRDGSLDESFAGVGKTIVYFDLGTNWADEATGVAVQPDGKIVLAGYASATSDTEWVIAVARLGTDGFPDDTFGLAGKTTIEFDLGDPTTAVAYDVVVQHDGKIVIVGHAVGGGSPFGLAAVRLLEGGDLDESFGEGGRILVNLGPGSAIGGTARSVAIQADGKIVLAGDVMTGSIPDANCDLVIARLLPDGGIDSAFGEDGKVVVPFDLAAPDFTSDWAYDVDIQPDGKIIAAGLVTSGVQDREFGIVRLLDDGSLDPNFGGLGGRAIIEFDLGGPGQNNEDLGYALALQSDHKLVLAGVVDAGVDHRVLGVARLMTDLVHVDGFDGGDTSAWSDTVPPTWCVIMFDDAFAQFGHGSDPEWYYGPYGVHFDNTNGFGVIGGVGNGDPGDWDIEGTNGSAAWGLWAGYHGIHFDAPVTGVSLDLLRGHDDLVITLNASYEGNHVGSQVLSLSGSFDVETAIFPGPIDTITWDAPCCYGLDNIVYTGNLECP